MRTCMHAHKCTCSHAHTQTHTHTHKHTCTRVLDQSRASNHHSHQDAGCNESHVTLAKRVVGNDQLNQDWSHLLLPVSQERRVHPADHQTRNPPARHPNIIGVKLDRKLTWSPHISTMHSKGLRKMALMKKLARTKWGANMKCSPRFTSQLSDPTWSMPPVPGHLLQRLTWIS